LSKAKKLNAGNSQNKKRKKLWETIILIQFLGVKLNFNLDIVVLWQKKNLLMV
jgi:hypothetical protein